MEPREVYLLKRGQVATLLGVSVSAVRRWERRKELHPIKDRDGIHRFDRQEVAELAAKRGRVTKATGDIAAQVFDLFRRGMKLGDIVIETKQTPTAVRALYLEWTTPLGAKPEDPELVEQREQASHEEMMREWDREQHARRRRTT